MNDAFYEHFVARKSGFTNILKRILLIVGVFFLTFLLSNIIGIFAFTLGLLGIILVIFLVFPYFKVEYEYSLLNHDLDISAIYSQEKRKKKAELDLQKAEIIAPTGSPRLSHYNPVKTLDFSSGNKDAKTYSIMTSINDTLTNIIIEPDEAMLSHMRSWMGSKMYFD